MIAAPGLQRRAADFRHGVVMPPQRVRRTGADLEHVINVAVPWPSADRWQSASGGIGRDGAQAELAAIGEALERYAASVCPLPERALRSVEPGLAIPLCAFSLYSREQRSDLGFPHGPLDDDSLTYTAVYSLADNSEAWAPAPLVGLRPEGGGIATSSGLASARSPHQALLRAAQELVERDALAITWLHGVRGRRVELAGEYREPVAARGGEVTCIDATPAYSSHPVAFVAGQLPLRGRPRFSLGAACRERWSDAVEKAYLEWLQGVTFAGYYCGLHPGLELRSAADVRTFDDHAAYYTLNPQQWRKVPLLRGGSVSPVGDEPTPKSSAEALRELAAGLRAEGIRLYYRDLTTIDLLQVGVHAVRVLSPELAPIHCDERWPFLGGSAPDVGRRYPWATSQDLCFPNPHPHPLG